MKPLILSLLLAIPALAAKPNILFILADDLGYGDLSCYGQTRFQTPAIDELAAGGIRFTGHYSGSTVCAPARASLMTGKDTGHTAIRGNGSFELPATETTVATLLRQAGYRTALIGKSCVTGNTQTPQTLARHGFDYFYGTTDHRDGHFRYPKFLYENTKRIDFPDNNLHTGSHYDLDLYTEKALAQLDAQSAEKPFFLLLSIPVPHASINLPEESIPGKPVKHPHYTRVADPQKSYAGLMGRIDKTVGALSDKLREKDLLDNTIVIFTSDNGPHAEGGYQPAMLKSSGVLRGHKRGLYEGGIRVPFIVHWPASIRPGRTSPHPSAFWDFLPTVCELTGIPAPANIQGISYLPILTEKEGQAAHDHLYWELNEQGGRQALRAGDWKIVRYDLNKKPAGPIELYNLKEDPSETTDLAGKHPDVLGRLTAMLQKARVPCPLFPWPALD
jgi:arylsulfatase A-like enzyme